MKKIIIAIVILFTISINAQTKQDSLDVAKLQSGLKQMGNIVTQLQSEIKEREDILKEIKARIENDRELLKLKIELIEAKKKK